MRNILVTFFAFASFAAAAEVTIARCGDYRVTADNTATVFTVEYQNVAYPAVRTYSTDQNDDLIDIEDYSAVVPSGSVKITRVTTWYPQRDRVKDSTASGFVQAGVETLPLICD